ncbi:hypothetical protein HDE_14068 [Halotydeus destructor]|nr:hypothetical protein HDE_14068 [Halotydeus destructor]
MSIQLFHIVNDYLGYKTVTQVSADTPNVSSPVDVTICYSYSEIFNYDQFNRNSGTNVHPAADYHDNLGLFTVNEIFRYTPSFDQLFARLRFRYPGDYKFTQGTASYWKDKIHVTKFVTQGFICYTLRVKPRNQTRIDYDYSQVARSLTFSSAIYHFDLNVTARGMKIMVHQSGSRPTNVIMLSPLFLTQRTANGEFITVSYKVLLVKSKEPPYETMCRDYSPLYRGKSDCIRVCSRQASLAQLDKIPYDIFEYDSNLNKKHVAPNDLDNVTSVNTLARIKHLCDSKCGQPNCLEYSIITRISRSPDPGKYLRVAVTIPSEPSMAIDIREAIKLLDLVIYIMSSAGTWLGLSVLSLDPSKWLPKRKSCARVSRSTKWATLVAEIDGARVKHGKLDEVRQ